MAVGALFLDYRSVSADCRRRLRFLETTLEASSIQTNVLYASGWRLVGRRMNRAFSADGVWADEPRALPWAGMNDALGVSHLALPLDLG